MSVLKNIRQFFDQLGQNIQNSFQPSRSNGSQEEEDEETGPPRDSMQRRQSVAAESFDPEEDNDENNEEKRIVFPKTDSQRVQLNNAVKEIVLFKCLDEEQISLVIDAMQEKEVSAGEIIIQQGDDGDNFYVIGSGTYDVYVRPPPDSKDPTEKKVHSYVDKGFFGELALMYNTSRAATVKAVTNGVLWFMDRGTFRRIVLKVAFHKRQQYEEFLKEVSIFKELSPYELISVSDALQPRLYEDGDCIITQGETGKEMFIVESGAVKIIVKEKHKEIEVNTLQKGAYFGEMALITKKPRAASVYAVGKTKVAVLDVASFERLLGPCVKVMERNMDTYQEQIKALLGSSASGPNTTL